MSSPKRALDDSEADTPSRKFMRGESPIKGAAGKRIATAGGNSSSAMSATVPTTNTNMSVGGGSGGGGGGFAVKNFVPGGGGGAQQSMPVGGGGAASQQAQQQAPPAPPSLPRQVTYLLSILPSAASYNATRFDPAMMVSFLSGVPLPSRS